jgi:hypothetical protein
MNYWKKKRKFNMLRSLICFLAAVLFGGTSFGQGFKWLAKVDTAGAEQYYRIILNSQITSRLRPDYGDIRIYNNAGNEVPYLLKTAQPVNLSNEFKNYEIIERSYKKGCCTYLVVRNVKKEKIDNIILKIKNADASKKIKLSGSDDNKTWFIIKEDYNFNSIYSSTESVVEQMLAFPLSDYEYFRIDIDDSLSNPVNILSAGYYVSRFKNAEFIDIPLPSVKQRDSVKLKKSFIDISFDKPYYLDKILFEFSGSENFYRDAELMMLDPSDTTRQFGFFTGMTLSSRSENSIETSRLWVKDLMLVIHNEDNSPLKISSVQATEKKSFLIARLKSGDAYILKYSDDNLGVPAYDLRYYEDKIPASPPEINLSSIINIENKAEVKEKFTPFFKNTWFIWGAIILVALLLGLMTVRMMREMKDGNVNS